jgi:hypothetical protein
MRIIPIGKGVLDRLFVFVHELLTHVTPDHLIRILNITLGAVFFLLLNLVVFLLCPAFRTVLFIYQGFVFFLADFIFKTAVLVELLVLLPLDEWRWFLVGTAWLLNFKIKIKISMLCKYSLIVCIVCIVYYSKPIWVEWAFFNLRSKSAFFGILISSKYFSSTTMLWGRRGVGCTGPG